MKKVSGYRYGFYGQGIIRTGGDEDTGERQGGPPSSRAEGEIEIECVRSEGEPGVGEGNGW